MNTRRPVTKLVEALYAKFLTKSTGSIKEMADFIEDWFDEDQADYVFKENVALYVCKLSSTNTHCAKVIQKGRGFSFLKRGDAFDFSHEGFHEAEGQGRIYQATSKFKHGRICADVMYNPER